uniref:Uncharacterized protein n=1 Tax=Ananas comosus var. bracteatus TaxID=296719 RepID=A0A6V7PUJ8_ANACO|nr:unnamed protein product [Ananas comosus var. bracteatus]
MAQNSTTRSSNRVSFVASIVTTVSHHYQHPSYGLGRLIRKLKKQSKLLCMTLQGPGVVHSTANMILLAMRAISTAAALAPLSTTIRHTSTTPSRRGSSPSRREYLRQIKIITFFFCLVDKL